MDAWGDIVIFWISELRNRFRAYMSVAFCVAVPEKCEVILKCRFCLQRRLDKSTVAWIEYIHTQL